MTQDIERKVAPPRAETTSALLREMLADLAGETVTVDHVVQRLRRRSFGGMFILLAAVGLLPGLSLFAGLAMIVPAIQMALGFRAPALPGFMSRRQIDVFSLRKVCNYLIPWIERLERFVKPRWLYLTLPPMPNVLGILALGLAFVIMLPLPFSNLPPAIALLCLSLGMLERDGLVISIGLAVTAMALAVGVLVGIVVFRTIVPVLDNIG